MTVKEYKHGQIETDSRGNIKARAYSRREKKVVVQTCVTEKMARTWITRHNR